MVKFLFILLIAVVGVLARPDIFYPLEKAEEYFLDFIQQYGKHYSSIVEKAMKFEIFKQSLLKYNKLNLENEHAEFGINEYADQSPGDVVRLKSVEPPLVDVCTIKEVPDVSPPESWDWREHNVVTRVKNQGHCGSCWAFSAIGNLESQYAIKYGQLLSFSEQQLMDCLNGPSGCYGVGNNEQMAFKYYRDGYGVMTEDDYPYLKDDGQFCAYDPNKVKMNVTGCEEYRLSNEYDVMKVLYSRGPLAVSIDDTDVGHGGYTKGIMSRCSYFQHGHAVLLVGYGTVNNVSYWTYKNSWGQLWGEDGYFRVKRGINGCGLLKFQITTGVIE